MSECLGRLLQPYSVDLTAIAALSGAGYARRIGSGDWALDSVVPVTRGGTGLATLAQGDLLYGSALDTLLALPKDANATRYLSNTGTSNNPAWSQVNLANGVAGTLPTSSGGTSFATYAEGDLLYGNGGGTLSKLAIPFLPGYVLASTSGVPAWEQLSTLTATTVTGTADQVLVNGTSGSGQTGPVTLTLPQDIHTGATPTFGAATLSRGVPAAYNALDITNTDATGFARITLTANALQAGMNWVPASFLKAVVPNTAPFLVEINGVNRLTVTATGINGTVIGNSTPESATFTGVSVTALSGPAALNFTAGAWNQFQFAARGSAIHDFFIYSIRTNTDLLSLRDVDDGDRMIIHGSMQTGAPAGGTAQPWKLGSIVTTASALDATRYVEAEINGVACKLALIT